MIEDAIQQGLMFDIPEEYWESLEECDRMLATWEEKICNLISDPIEEQGKAQVILPKIKKVLDKYPEVISKRDWDIGNCNLVEHEIHLEHDWPIKSPVWYINPRLADWLKGELQKMEEIGVIQKFYSPYASPITIVKVLRSDDKWKIRLCSDTTELNKVTIKDAGLLPNFRMIFDKLGEAIIYTIIDMIAEY